MQNCVMSIGTVNYVGCRFLQICVPIFPNLIIYHFELDQKLTTRNWDIQSTDKTDSMNIVLYVGIILKIHRLSLPCFF